ncbi:MAG: hypothetical protein P4N59_30010 [Negativicutes bacterium]|nr:hypothetical protein [Negativicutes bacterium]
MARKSSVEGINVLGKAWGEVKKINWHEVNRLCQENFHIGLMGTDKEIAAMQAWLRSYPYLVAGHSVKAAARAAIKDTAQYVTVIAPQDGVFDEKLIKSTTFCLAGRGMANEVRRLKGEVFLFDDAENYSLTTQILSNHREVQFALAHNFPVFRPELAQSAIQDTAFQNAAWALLSGLPNSVPGPHHLLTAPFEGITDFTILTLNEFKLLFELVGLSGYRVTPLHHLIEFGMIIGLGKLAETIAINTVGKLTGRTGIIAKGAIAYAFTWTIGEVIFFYISTGHKLSRDAMTGRFHQHHVRGKKAVAEMVSEYTH